MQCRIPKARKSDVNGLETKAEVKTTAKYIQFDAWVRPKGVMLNRSRVNGSKCKNAYYCFIEKCNNTSALRFCIAV